MFWLALLREEDLVGHWEGELRAALTDPDDHMVPPLCLPWKEGRANLAAAQDLADRRLPELARLLRDWVAGLERLSEGGPTQQVQLLLGEYTNFHETADSFLAELRRGVRLWQGPDRPELPPVRDVGRCLTGFDPGTDLPFPHAMPVWLPELRASRSTPGSDRRPPTLRQRAAEWGMVALVAGIVLGSVSLGLALLGSAGGWVAGLLGLTGATVAVWKWEKRGRIDRER